MQAQLTGQIHVEVDSTPSADLNHVISEIREQYEGMVAKYRRGAEAWFKEKARGHIPTTLAWEKYMLIHINLANTSMKPNSHDCLLNSQYIDLSSYATMFESYLYFVSDVCDR